MNISVPSFLLDATPGAREAIAALEAAQAARAALRVEYPEGIRPLAEVSRYIGDVLAPRPGVTSAEFDASRVAHELYTLNVASAERAVKAATEVARSMAYGFGLDAEVIAARREHAADRLEAIDGLLEAAPMTMPERRDLEAERVLAERYALVADPGALEGVARSSGARVTVRGPGGVGFVVDADGVQRSDNRPWSYTRADGRVVSPRPVTSPDNVYMPSNGQTVRAHR